MNRYLSPWTDVTVHGKPWWRVHLWPHVVGGIAMALALLLPVWTVDSLFGRALIVLLVQSFWELSQIVTWANKRWLRIWSWLWEPIPMDEGWSWKVLSLAVKHVTYGTAWAMVAETALRNPTALAALAFTLGMQLFVSRLEHENYRGPGSYWWQRLVPINLALGACGWQLAQL